MSWLLSIALSLGHTAAQSSSAWPPTVSYSLFTPPPRWSTGQPYTTLGFTGQPMGTLVTITTRVQVFPTAVEYVATGLLETVSSSVPSTVSAGFYKPTTVNGVPGYYYFPLLEKDVKASTSYTLNMTDVGFVTCWYPISGTLPRILFYVTIASAGLLRHHLRWLYVGALAASLTYSGCAAIRACLLVWYGHAYGELDLIPLLGILSVSGIILVPLLTWSSTIRTAGPGEKKEIAEEEKEIDSSARTILVLWGLLVVVGLLSAYVAFIDGIAYGELGLWGVNTFSSPDTLTCAPQSGYLNITVGQEPARGLDGFSEYNFFSGNKDFVDANNCQYPCSRPYGEPALFRTNSDLVPLSSFEELALAGMRLNLGARARTFVLGYAYRWSYTIAFVMLQGIWTVCFGARTPSQTRTTIYGYLSGGRTRRRRGNPRLFVRLVACATALLFYLWSVFVVLLTIPLLVVHISAVELFVGQLPQSEPATHVGAWSPYASTTLVILGASFARLWSSIEWDSLKSRAHPKRLSQIIRSSCGSRKPTKPTASHGSHRNALRKVDDAFLAAAHLVFGHGTRKRVRKGWDDYIMFFVQPESQCHDLWYPDCKDYPACHNDVDYHSLHRTNHPEVTSAEAHVAVDVAPQIPMLHSALDVSMESLIQHTFLQHHPTG